MYKNNKLKMALKYAKKDWKLIPIFEINKNGNCACCKSDCSSPVKHPMIMNGLKDATTDINVIKAHWKK